ncbi:MAG: acyl-CoA/acyl-ACP dehydrogenase [Verrucomicrobia bacterium]|nr:acyl-CoA/acyl-ACP dehydrogenase [Verrucomicrobiota bacterium]
MKSCFENYLGSGIMPELKAFVGQKIQPNLREWEEKAEIPESTWEEMHRLGLWSLAVPKELGGEGAPTVYLAEIMKELAYGSSALATAFTASIMSGLCIFFAGETPLRENYANRILEHGDVSAFAMTEKEGGSDLSNIQTTAKVVPGGYLLNGEKCFVTNANIAKHFVILARLEHERRTSRGLTMFYVPAGTAGLEVNAAYKKFGQNAVRTCPISLKEVFVPDNHRLGEPGSARDLSYRILQRSRCFLAAGAIGLCSRADDLAREYLSKRVILRRSLLSQPVIRHLFTQLNTEKEAAWQLILSAAKDWDDNALSLHRVNMAKLFAAQVANRFVSGMMELYGGWSYTDTYEIEQLLRDVKFYEAVEGPAFVQQILITRGLFPSKVQ